MAPVGGRVPVFEIVELLGGAGVDPSPALPASGEGEGVAGAELGGDVGCGWVDDPKPPNGSVTLGYCTGLGKGLSPPGGISGSKGVGLRVPAPVAYDDGGG